MIEEFKGKYRFLSNFYPCRIEHRKWIFSTSEHFFQALKARNNSDKVRIWRCRTPGDAKRMGRQVELRPGWDKAKLCMMRLVLHAKFQQNLKLRKKLLKTGTEELVEGNSWHDNFWGDCKCERCKNIEGKNHLGLLLMKLRKELLG